MRDLIRRIDDLDQRIRDIERQEAAVAGTFTPTLVGGVTPGTFTYDATTGGAYTRIGDLVIVRGQVRISAITVAPTGNLYIGNMPFLAATITWDEAGGFALSTWHGLTFPAGYVQLGAYVLSGESRLGLIRNGSGQAAARVQGSELSLISSVALIRFTGAYQI